MSRSQKVEEIKSLFEAGALTREEYQTALRRVDEEEKAATGQPPAREPEPELDDPALAGSEKARLKKPKSYQTSTTSGYWRYQDRTFEENEGLEEEQDWGRYAMIGGGILILILLLTTCG